MCKVTYCPTEPGNYFVSIRFAEEHIPGKWLLSLGGGVTSEKNAKALRPGLNGSSGHVWPLGLGLPASALRFALSLVRLTN